MPNPASKHCEDNGGTLELITAKVCSMLEDFPDYPTYLISECVDETGNSISR